MDKLSEEEKRRAAEVTEAIEWARTAPDGSLFLPPEGSGFLAYGKLDGEWYLIGSKEDLNHPAGFSGAAGFAHFHGFTRFQAKP